MANGTKANTPQALLAAAEAILVEKGVNALSVRRIGQAAGMNAALVTYHFGSLYGLLDELCTLNMEPLLQAWQRIDESTSRSRQLDDVLRCWLEPLLLPACFNPGGRALVVLDEIAAHGEDALKLRVLTAMEQFVGRLRAVLGPLLPSLDDTELRARLRFVSGAALGPPPRTSLRAGAADGAERLDGMAYLLPFAKAALSG